VETRKVAQQLIHPDHLETPNPNFRMLNDVMLVKLDQRSNEPTKEWNTIPSPAAGGTVDVLGFGRTNGTVENSFSPTLLTTRVIRNDDNACANVWGGSFTFLANFCYGTTTTGTCNGDSGSPIFDPATGKIAGLVSFGKLDCPAAAPVAADVSNFAPWIQEK